jgi:hypothetical protein
MGEFCVVKAVILITILTLMAWSLFRRSEVGPIEVREDL